MLDNKRQEIGDLILKNEGLFKEFESKLAENKQLKLSAEHHQNLISQYRKDFERIYDLMGSKDKDRSGDKILNWFEFKISEHKIFRQKTQKLLLKLQSQQNYCPNTLEIIPEIDSHCETENKVNQ